jgi:hypothetical protein
MGSWTIHVEGHGIHDNGREDDADSLLEAFIAALLAAGHAVNRASFTVGARRSTHQSLLPGGHEDRLTVNE